MEQPLHMESSVESGVVTVTATGEVDMATADLLTERVDQAFDLVPAPRAVVVDLSGVRLLAAAGVAVLVAAHQSCEQRGVRWWVVAPSRAARRALELFDLVSVLHVVAESPRVAFLDDVRDRALEVALRPPAATTASKLVIDLVAAAWETESAEHRAHLSGLASALSGQGHRVSLHIRRTSADLPESERVQAGFEVVRVPAGPTTALSRAELLPHLDEFASVLDRKWADRVPDIAHLHSWLSGLAVRETAVPLVQSFHGLEIDDPRGTGRLVELERLTALAADRVIAASADEMSKLVRTGVTRAKVSHVPWGVDTDAFRPDGPVAPRGAGPRVLALGEVARHSGFDAVVEAMVAVPDAELLVVGPIRSATPREDPEMARLVGLARKHGVGHRLRFTGQVNRSGLPALLRSADVVVCVPSREPSGIGALQAMACGVPVIATAVGALADIVIDDVTGVLVPPHDAIALGQALRDLLVDSVRREVYTITSVDRVHARYSWDRVVAEFVDVYRKTTGVPRYEAVAARS